MDSEELVEAAFQILSDDPEESEAALQTIIDDAVGEDEPAQLELEDIDNIESPDFTDSVLYDQ